MNKLTFLLVTLMITCTIANGTTTAPQTATPQWLADTERFFNDGLSNLCITDEQYRQANGTVQSPTEFCNAVRATFDADTCFHHVPSELLPAERPTDAHGFCMRLANKIIPGVRANAQAQANEDKFLADIIAAVHNNQGDFRNAIALSLCYAASRNHTLPTHAGGEATCHQGNAQSGSHNTQATPAKKVRMLAKHGDNDGRPRRDGPGPDGDDDHDGPRNGHELDEQDGGDDQGDHEDNDGVDDQGD